MEHGADVTYYLQLVSPKCINIQKLLLAIFLLKSIITWRNSKQQNHALDSTSCADISMESALDLSFLVLPVLETNHGSGFVFIVYGASFQAMKRFSQLILLC